MYMREIKRLGVDTSNGSTFGPGEAIGLGLTMAASFGAGAGAAEAPEAVSSGGELATVGDFRDTASAFTHYAKHVQGVILRNGSATVKAGGADMPEFGSFSEYRAAARQFMGGGTPSGVMEGIRSNGDLLRFDPSSGYFGIQSGGGVIRTFFRPDDGIGYFFQQFS
ncbi:MAG TPA: hypothetical protein VMV07_06125, partial [Streptosporangiaceae bacterium]|nr:hypothetical protein [Streptosporangiaceae bacterium]